MLPMFPLDGSKVFVWNKIIWFGFIVLSLGFGYFVFQSIDIVVMWGILLLVSLIMSRAFIR